MPLFDLSPVIRQRFFDSGGNPLAGGLLYSYIAGTTTPLATYTDSTGATPNTNPVVLDAAGYANVWMSSNNYKFILQDSLGNAIWSVDNVKSTQQMIADQINLAGALAASNNLSDLSNVTTALHNLGIAPFSYQTVFTGTSGQSATNLSGETFSNPGFSSVIFNYEISQGTTIFSTGDFSIHFINGAWQLVNGGSRDSGSNAHGVIFSLSGTTTAQLRAAESGLGNFNLKLKKSYFF